MFPNNKRLALEATFIENYFLPFSGFVMLMPIRDALNFKFPWIISLKPQVLSEIEQAQ